jgi:hypothetical protein
VTDKNVSERVAITTRDGRDHGHRHNDIGVIVATTMKEREREAIVATAMKDRGDCGMSHGTSTAKDRDMWLLLRTWLHSLAI